MPSEFNLDLPRFWKTPLAAAEIKSIPVDFYVEENLQLEFAGEGEHDFLFVEKTGYNTQDIARELSQRAGVKQFDVGFSGMKDKNAVTRQWYSVPVTDRSPDWLTQTIDGVSILQYEKHQRKLRKGQHQNNFFRIRLRNFQGEQKSFEERVQQIKENGVPNYFGKQRFGRDGSNLYQIDEFVKKAKGKQQGFRQRLNVSVARAWLFNQVLACRVTDGSWNQAQHGDELLEGLPTGPLWGRGRLSTSAGVKDLEEKALGEFESWCHFLEHCGLNQQRRSLVLMPENLKLEYVEGDPILSFTLPAGGYATSLLRELIQD